MQGSSAILGSDSGSGARIRKINPGIQAARPLRDDPQPSADSPTPRPTGLRARRRARSRGQALVELALVTPLLLLLFAAAADLGRAFYAYVAVENAAKEGALFGSRTPL